MSIKEERRILIETDSPARRHSMNQRTLKQYLEWEKEWLREIEAPLQESDTQEFVLDRASLAQELPLHQEFTAGCLDFMIEIARERSLASEEGLTIPQRTKNIVEDVAKIYNFSRKQGLHSFVISPDGNSERRSVAFRACRESARYPGLFPRISLLPLFKRFQEFDNLAPRTQMELVQGFCKTFEINLTSCDFSLSGNELVVDRVRCYGYTLSSLGNLTYALFGNLEETRVFDAFLGGARNILNAKK